MGIRSYHTDPLRRQAPRIPRGASRLVAAGAAVALVLCPGPVWGQRVEQSLWGTDGSVDAVVRAENTIYIGGSFTMVGPNTGGGVPVDRRSGLPVSHFPQVAGSVHVVIPDAEGGWFIGGSFVAVGGQPRSNLARILADGRVSDWAPDPDGQVLALALAGPTMYVGGSFSHVGGQARSCVAALDVVSEKATAWNPAPDARVRALLFDRGRLYVGGDFGSIGGQGRNSLAELDPVAGSATEWNPDVGFSWPGSVRALAICGDTLYVGGLFGRVGLQYRYNLAAIDVGSGLATDWNPRADGPDDRYYGSPYVSTLAVKGNSVYAGGHFTAIGGTARGGLTEIDRLTGQVTGWNPDPGPWTGTFNRDVTFLAVRESTVCVGGYFTSVGGKPRSYVAELSLSTGWATDWNPNANDPVFALAASGEAVYVGGAFIGLGPEWQRRKDLAALDATTGRLKDWNPDPNGFGVLSLALSHGRMYVCGYFSTIGGETRYGLAALDTLTGMPTEWAPTTNNWVRTLEVAGDTLYVGGMFTAMDGVPRGRLASFDLNAGALTSWNPSAASDVDDLAVIGNTVYVAGFFRTIGGITRNHIAAVDAVGGAVTDWNPNADGSVNAMAVVGDTIFVGGWFDTIGGNARQNLAALDATTGSALDWVADADQEVHALAVLGDTLFVGGHFQSVGGEPRGGLAALNVSSAAVLPWDPELSGVEWWPGVTHPNIWSLAVCGSDLYVGGLFGRIGPIPAGGFAAVSFAAPAPEPTPAPELVALAPMFPNPVHASATIRLALPSAGPVSLTVYDLQGRRMSSVMDRTMMPAGVHEVALHAEGWPEGFYFVRLQAGGVSATRKFVVLR